MGKSGRRELYRHYDKNGRLLYVGITVSVVLRTAQHVKVSDWFNDVVRIDIERYASVEDALKAEGVAIVNESPLYNKVVSVGCGGRPRIGDGYFSFNQMARAAIEAMRVPTREMVDAAWNEMDGGTNKEGPLVRESSTSHSTGNEPLEDDTAFEVWSAMIDAALAEKAGK